MNRASVMLLKELPPNIGSNCCFLVEGSTHYHEASKTRTELWDLVLVYPDELLYKIPHAYRFLSAVQFGYGG